MSAPQNGSMPLPTAPSLRRRLACAVYESTILFGVVWLAAYLWGSLTQQRNALEGRHGLQLFVFLVLGVYFSWFWSHGGQTVAMKTWHIRVEQADGRPLSQARAIARYAVSWLWLLPVVAAWLLGRSDLPTLGLAMVASLIGYPMLALLHPQRQYWHDVACGTRLVDVRPLS